MDKAILLFWITLAIFSQPAVGDTYFSKEQRDNIYTDVPITGSLCGHACVKMALDLYGIKVTLEELKAQIPYNDEGASVLSLVKAINKYGLTASWFKQKNIDDLFENENDILIIRINKKFKDVQVKHYVMIIKRYYDRYLVVDPFGSTYITDEESLQDIYIGDGLRVSKEVNIMPRWKEALFSCCLGYIFVLFVTNIFSCIKRRSLVL